MRLTAEEIEAKAAKNRAAWQTPVLVTLTKRPVYVTKAPFTEAEKKKLKRRGVKTVVRVATEHEEQCRVIEWCNQHPVAKHIFAIPNGSYKSAASAAKFKREGLRSGVPDLFLPVARHGFHGLFVEMKRTKGSVTSKEQLAWIEFLSQQGFACLVCKGADAAIQIIEGYLSGK